MRIYILLILSLFICFSCVSIPVNNVNGRKMTSQDGETILIGKQSVKIFEKSEFPWFKEEYDSYNPETEVVKKLKNKLKISTITVFVGSWCSDTQREFPRLIKILDQAKFPRNRIIIYAVNQKKESLYGEELSYGIKKVPTIIIKRFSAETGRIIETPKESLELDLLHILNKDYDEK